MYHYHFESLPDIWGDGPDKIHSVVLCKHCGKLSETGVMNLHNHLMSCAPYLKKCYIDLSPENCKRMLENFIKTGKF